MGTNSFPVRNVVAFHRSCFYPFSPFYNGFYGFYGYPFGFSLGVSFGYPYYPYCGSYYYPWYSYSPCHSVYVAYPYVGYYYVYPYPYLSCYDGYDCDFYDGYYVRFGYYRTSYYVACSGFGPHAYHHHHCHYHDCSVHGYHYYHVRDCPLCYPEEGSYVVHDVNVPDAPAEAPSHDHAPAAEPSAAAGPEAPAEAGAKEPQAVEARSLVEKAPGEASEKRPLERDEAFFASLRPAQLNFAMGLIQFRNGNYDEASESYYNASLEDPDSRLVKVFLGVSLFALQEYRYSADYLRLALADWPGLTDYGWSLRGLYGNPDDLAAHLALLEEEVRLNPADADAALVLVFLSTAGVAPRSGSPGEALDRFRSLADDPADREIAARLVADAERRSGILQPALAPAIEAGAAEEAPLGDPATRAFLSSLELKDVPALPLR